MAEFAYDALGRRIEKKDLIDPNNTTRYYYNNNWQVLCEYNEPGSFQRLFMYGNYIDEVLLMYSDALYYYVHDHLYSPVALHYANGTVVERYEYDAYGNCYVLEPNFAPDPDGKSDFGNPCLFTGRRVDILDNGSLKIQYNRNRYYDYYTGRWLTHDPLGYIDGMNLYEYVGNMPTHYVDPLGFWGWHCGKDECKKGEITYEIFDRIITPLRMPPWYPGAIRDAEIGFTTLRIETVAKVVFLIWKRLSPAQIVAEIGVGVINEAMVWRIKREYRSIIAQLAEGGAHSYLEVRLKRCKKHRWPFPVYACWRYKWKKDKKTNYYLCTAGSPGEYGVYANPEDAASHLAASEDTFEDLFDIAKHSRAALRKLFDWRNPAFEEELEEELE